MKRMWAAISAIRLSTMPKERKGQRDRIGIQQFSAVHDKKSQAEHCRNYQFTPDHLDRHKTMECYSMQKRRFLPYEGKRYRNPHYDDPLVLT
jgi:hypothetical protein